MAMHIPSVMQFEFLGDVPFYAGMGIKILTALLLGGMIGFDREMKMKPAGLKTNILICLGSTLYTSISIMNAGMSPNADPNRMAAQIVSGIGFLGAGAILHGKGNVSGLTTAATIWLVAAIGFTIGSGYPLSAAIFTITVLVVLVSLNPLFRFLSLNRYFHLEVLGSTPLKEMIQGILLGENAKVKEFHETKTGKNKTERIYHAVLQGNFKSVSRAAQLCRQIESVTRVRFYNYDEDKPVSISHEDDKDKGGNPLG
jgi:putative Mg2+ transporter-C (MgtC) family protein